MTGNCEYQGCQKLATDLVYNRVLMVMRHYCKAHANYVLDLDVPEYIVECPKCGCRFGVN